MVHGLCTDGILRLNDKEGNLFDLTPTQLSKQRAAYLGDNNNNAYPSFCFIQGAAAGVFKSRESAQHIGELEPIHHSAHCAFALRGCGKPTTGNCVLLPKAAESNRCETASDSLCI